MELTESIKSLNAQLTDLFGIDTLTGASIWRISWSEDQFEKRYGTYDDFTPGGLYIRTISEVREVPKYRQWVQEKYVLERLTVVPEMNAQDLPTSRLSYEPMYVFENRKGGYLPPRLDVAKFIIDSVYAAQGKSSLAKYLEPEENEEIRAARIQEMQEYLFSDETDISDSLSRQEGVVVPHNYSSHKEN